MRRILTYILWIGVIVFLIAAAIWLLRLFRGSPPPVVEVNQPALATCTPDCISFGQCGTTINDDKLLVVLTGSEPRLQKHNMYLYNNAEVQVIQSATGTMAYLPGMLESSRQEVQFWLVQLPNNAQPPSWVAEWCVQPVE